MIDYRLSKEELASLHAAHSDALNVREAYRINAVMWLGKRFTASDVADALLIDPGKVRNYFSLYKQRGVDALWHMNYVSSEALLDALRLAELDTPLEKHLHLTAALVAAGPSNVGVNTIPRAG